MVVIIVGKVDLFSRGKRRKEGHLKKEPAQKNNHKNIKHKQQHPPV